MDKAEYQRIEREIERINADNAKRQSLGGRKYKVRYTDEERAAQRQRRLDFERSKLNDESHPLRVERLSQNLTISELSDNAIVGRSTIHGIESRRAKATSRSTKLRLAAALKAGVDELFPE